MRSVFTGIVEQIGTIVARHGRGLGARFVVACAWTDLALGESIAVNGVCLTVDEILAGHPPRFEADASTETLSRSTLRDARGGARVNLERAVTPTSRLGGHFVAGHVDARSKLLSRRPLGDATELRFELPEEIARFVASKGSIAIDGVSLTVNHTSALTSERAASVFDVVVVPHTLRTTTLVDLPVGAQVNLEVDVLARYVARQLGTDVTARSASSAHDLGNDERLISALRGSGYL